MNPRCIVCGKQIGKRMRGLSFSPASANQRSNGERDDGTIYLDLDQRPRNKEEAQRYTNHEILRITMSHGRVYSITWWEGEYNDPFFHSLSCAAIHGRRAARAGYR